MTTIGGEKKYMQYNQQLQQYVRRNVEGTNPGDLIVLLYDAAISSMNMGKAKLGERDIEGTHNALMRALRVLEELISCLNMEKGGEIARNLLSIYVYVRRRLTEANTAKESAGIDEALVLMESLRMAWKKALTQKIEEDRGVYAQHDAPSPQPAASDSPPAPKPLNISI
jgi:flagellar protein FliS